MPPTNRDARIAAVLYLLMAFPGPFCLLYIPRTLIVAGDATATASKILGHEMLFRSSIVLGLLSCIFFLLLALALHRLLAGVNKTQAALMVIFVGVSVAIWFLNELNDVAALTLFRGADFLSVFDKPQRDALGLLFLRLHSQGNVVNETFWGLWLIPFGYLVMRSGFLPRILGILLIVNGLAYVVISFTSLLWPSYGPLVFNASQPALFGEVWIMLWLLIKGVKVRETPAEAYALG